MGDTPRTTIVALVMQEGVAFWAHCGDSRLYVVRHEQLLTRTRDHSFSEQAHLAKQPLATANRNILFTCLGSPTRPIVDVSEQLDLQQGDRFLLCSDGLWSSLSEADIVHELCRKAVSDSAPELVERALRNAGDKSDNVTVLAVEWETPDAQESVRGVSTDSISDGVFASTIQAGGWDHADDDLDDEAIERSIAEINEAIRRTAARKA
jgi:serine/threonine protein phosphatase PrpC